ncbi:MAG: helix-turn-helix transcriptional regulator [Acidimicrobiia bacterium]|nr:helix-turn-helix transcriptional regulator [Acidimicrobiia bacterium]
MDIEHERPEFYAALGRTIQVLRTDQGLDRKDLADRAGISYSYLAAIENGKKPPSSKVLFAIASALGLLSHELLASVETRLRRQHQPGGTAEFGAAVPRRAWFHGAPPASRRAAAPTALGYAREQAPARLSGTNAPTPGTTPRSPSGFLIELERLNPLLDEGDRDLVVELARRLAAAEQGLPGRRAEEES